MKATFGNRFKQLRQELNLKQEELVKDFNNRYHYNFTRAAISQYENDKRIPEIDALKSFAEYFNVSVDYLLGNSDVRTIQTQVKDLFPGPGRLTDTDKGILWKENVKLTDKDKKDIAKNVEYMMGNLDKVNGLEFYNQPQDEEDLEYIKRGFERFLEDVKLYNKLKYTPKKYRK